MRICCKRGRKCLCKHPFCEHRLVTRLWSRQSCPVMATFTRVFVLRYLHPSNRCIPLGVGYHHLRTSYMPGGLICISTALMRKHIYYANVQNVQWVAQAFWLRRYFRKSRRDIRVHDFWEVCTDKRSRTAKQELLPNIFMYIKHHAFPYSVYYENTLIL
jgi:hypothetical protein